MIKMQISQTTFILYIIIFLLLGGAIGAWITRMLLRYPFGRNPLTGRDSYVGKKAVVVNKRPGVLRVAINSQVWNAECADPDNIAVGDIVYVMDMDNLTLKIEKRQAPDSMLPGDAMTNGPAS